MAGHRANVVRTATGRSLHLSTDMQHTHCGYQVAGPVALWELEKWKSPKLPAVCSLCLDTVVASRTVVMVEELSGPSSPPPQEPPGPQHKGMRPVRGRRRST
jgi:hypothetical protein